MKPKMLRVFGAIVLVSAAVAIGYGLGSTHSPPRVSSAVMQAPPADSIRVIYSLDEKQNDREIIALITAARSTIYFAMYEFTLKDIADALVAAKKRGVDVRGLVDAGESANSYDAPVIAELLDAGIPVVTEKHSSGNGIMHIKAIVTDNAYALGSYNWTGSATTENDELLEIGTNETLRQAYESILKKLLDTYAGNTALATTKRAAASIGTIDYTEAPNHIGKVASVQGVLVDAFASQSGTVFLDFCKSYKTCPFSGVIFAGDVDKFPNIDQYAGRIITVTGKITSYQGKAEIVVSDPSQLSQ